MRSSSVCPLPLTGNTANLCFSGQFLFRSGRVENLSFQLQEIKLLLVCDKMENMRMFLKLNLMSFLFCFLDHTYWSSWVTSGSGNSREFLLVVLRDGAGVQPYGMLRFEPGSTTCKAHALPAVLSLTSPTLISLKDWGLFWNFTLPILRIKMVFVYGQVVYRVYFEYLHLLW